MKKGRNRLERKGQEVRRMVKKLFFTLYKILRKKFLEKNSSRLKKITLIFNFSLGQYDLTCT